MARNRKVTQEERKAHEANMARLFPDTWGRAARFQAPAPSPEELWRLEQAFDAKHSGDDPDMNAWGFFGDYY